MLIKRELIRPISKPKKVIKLGNQKNLKSNKDKLIQMKIIKNPNILDNKIGESR